MVINELDTPCLLLDYDAMLENMTSTHQFILNWGKAIRAHVKAHKCSQLAKIQMENGAHGLCTATLSEAEKLFEKGFDNILLTRSIVEKNKMQRVIRLAEQGKNVIVVVDSEEMADVYNKMRVHTSKPLQILLDIDIGFGRTGFKPESVLDIAERIQDKKNLVVRGIQAYHGDVQHIQRFEDRETQTLECMQVAADIFHEMKKRGFEWTIFSGSGTGTHAIDIQIKELTELQIGSYLLMDAQYLDVELYNENSLPKLKPALSVLTTVISNNNKDYVTVDSGLKSIYRDSPNPRVISDTDEILDYEWFGDEFGKIMGKRIEDKFKLGAKIKILPSHCDPTINLYDKIYLISGNEVIDSYTIDLRGCSQ